MRIGSGKRPAGAQKRLDTRTTAARRRKGMRIGPTDPIYREALQGLRKRGEGKLQEAASITVKGITFTVIGGKIWKSSNRK